MLYPLISLDGNVCYSVSELIARDERFLHKTNNLTNVTCIPYFIALDGKKYLTVNEYMCVNKKMASELYLDQSRTLKK